jgi:REP-associated tyrosine transposase
VQVGALFHIRIATDREKQRVALTAKSLGRALLDSAKFYDANRRWYISVFLLMPDHIHAILSFPRDKSMSRIIGDWKHFHAIQTGIIWQEGYFDHRLRDDERGEQLSAKLDYIQQNPVAAGFVRGCKRLAVVDRALRAR